MIFLNESMVNEIVVENNNTITLEQFDYFRESTYYSINQLIVEAEIGMVLNEGKIMDTIKAIIRKIKELFQKFIGWVVGLFRKAKNAIFGRKKNLENLKKDANKKAEEAKKQGKEYIVLRGPKLKEKEPDTNDTQDVSDNTGSDVSDDDTSETQKVHKGLRGPAFKDYKIDKYVILNLYDHIPYYKNADYKEYRETIEWYYSSMSNLHGPYFTKRKRFESYYGSESGFENYEEKFNDLKDLKYEFNLKNHMEIIELKTTNDIDGYNNTIEKIQKFVEYQEKIINTLQEKIDDAKKRSFDISIPDDVTEEQEKYLLKSANLVSNMCNITIKKMTEILDFETKILDVIYEKNMKELEKFTTIAV